MPESIAELVGRAGGSQRTLIAAVGLGAFAVIFGFAQWGMSSEWVPIVSGVPFETINEATQRLDEGGIEYRLERGGSEIVVAEEEAPRARVLLAAEGIITPGERPGFEIFDEPSWGMTDFTQRVNYRRALEGELERTIGRMRGVESVQVHLAIQESSFLRGADRASEASVVVAHSAGLRPDDSVVEGIQFLVASSVEALAPENVTVLDDRGRLLSNPDGEDGVALSSRQLQIRSQIENYLETKAQRMVEQMVGVGNVSIQVAADLNFDQIDRTVQDVNPDLQTIVSEDRSEITPGEEDLEGASSVTSNTVFETAHSVETLSRGGARLERMTVAVVVNDRRSEGADGTVTFSARTQQEMQRVEALVRNAVGVSNDRGDAISVVSMPFEGMPEALPPEGIDIFALLQALQRPLIALSGLLVAFFLGTRVLASFKAIPVGPVTRVEDMRMPASDEPGKLPVPDAVPAKPVRQQYQIVDPQMTAKVIRAWMKEA